MCVYIYESEVTQSYLTFATPWTVAHQVPPSMGFSRQEYWTGLLHPPPGDLPHPGIKPTFLTPPLWQGGFFGTPGNQQGPTVRHMEPYSIVYNNLNLYNNGKDSQKEAIYHFDIHHC